MHMILRTLLIFFTKRFAKKTSISEMTEYSMRVLPTDLDLLMHVNNGVYFSLMDFGRWDMIFRNGVYDACIKNDWYSVVASESIKFNKSLKLWDKFTIQTQIKAFDEKSFFIQQKFVSKGKLMATGLVRVRVLKKSGGSVLTSEVLKTLNETLSGNDEIAGEWQSLESKYLA